MKLLDEIIKQGNEKIMGLTGVTDEFFAMYISKQLKEDDKNILIVTPTLFEANQLKEIISTYNSSTYLFPMDDFLTSEAIAISPDLKITRLETINSLMDNNKSKEKSIVVTHLLGYLRYLPTKEKYEANIINLANQKEYNRNQLIKQLSTNGYEKATTVTKTGEFATRGFVIDIFPIGESHPIRVEFFGDDIESLRYFDEETQKSIDEVSSITIRPNSEFLADKNSEISTTNQKYLKDYSKKVVNIKEYLNKPLVVFKNYSQLEITHQKLIEEIFEYKSEKDTNYTGDYMFNLSDLTTDNILYYNTIDNIIKGINTQNIKDYNIKTIPKFSEDIEAINKFLKDNLHINKTIIIALKKYQIKNFTKFLETNYIITNINEITKNQVNIIETPIQSGFIYGNYIIITEKELFKTSINKNKYKTNFKYSSKIKDYKNLESGDYIVHNIHGIGIYNGIKTLTQNGLLKDYLELLYQGKDKIYIPVEKIELISKYNAKDGTVPKINKLGGIEWQKTKLRIRNKVKDIADKLLKLYAVRETKKGFQYSKDNDLQVMFEQEFSFQPTKDQELATLQIKGDMESTTPMDRLLCGDVGYGKTEVAFRAMFKAVNDGKQVLYLCPTTILSNQQYENAKERYKNFPVNIALLNRFTSKKETTKIIADLNNGKIDILFGTHRLLSNDIKLKNLGLLIIDEEQRFGVVHKEKIKEYKENVDVLTLTATPIPRTLQMSMAGLRSLSLIETPPVDRYPIQTYVVEESDYIIKDAIYKELSRNGQIFLLYNSVERIENMHTKISNLVPEARIVYAHGQLSKTELENRMLDFINREYDILLCTTIIETGIDIPNVNTLIILEADRFGLSQLYQIRGRVGRSNKIAYAYLMYNKNKILTETAIKRLDVIKEFTELGSGFSIATRDLSIRGAGDILGSEQAGFIENIGIELYLKMLNEEVLKLKGEYKEEEETTDEKPLINVETHIDSSYVEEDDLKIEIHKKINTIDSLDKLNEVKKEIEDRFGKINEKILIYMYQEWFEKLAKKMDIIKVNQTKNSIELTFSREATENINGEKLFTDAYNISRMFRFQLKNKSLMIILDTIKLEKHYIYLLTELLSTITEKS